MKSEPDKSEPRRCVVCGVTEGVRRISICLDGEPLRMQPDLCTAHSEQFILRTGIALGQLIYRKEEQT